ncbi:MAG: hypothetical protein U0903_03265 [Planctomycetales bacterium]
MTLRVLPEVWEEGFAAADWYESQRAGLADRFLIELDRAICEIERQASSFARWEPYAGSEEIRWASLGRFRYVVIFVIDGTEVVVLAITHMHRHPLHWLSRLG